MFKTQFFKDVQLSNIFEDSKTFADAEPKFEIEKIEKDYLTTFKKPGFSLIEFIKENFNLPEKIGEETKIKEDRDALKHLNNLWLILKKTTINNNSSLISLPKPFIVPGGRFREVYYWDSYFTMLGLQKSGLIQEVKDMIENFAYLIDNYGFIPNGNRTYFLSRSQPPFFSLMTSLTGESKKYASQLEKEYKFWMNSPSSLKKGSAYKRVVRLEDNLLLNRYFDDEQSPRAESFKEDYELAKDNKELYTELRAACESGWDFSARWFEDGKNLKSIKTTNFLPIDLNSLLYNLEKTLAEVNSDDPEKSRLYYNLAEKRKIAIQDLFFNEDFFYDYKWKENKPSSFKSLAATFPLFFKIATPNQAKKVAETIEKEFLKSGGLTTSLVDSGQQWDSPNGWAPLQYISYEGLKNYSFNDLAEKIRESWLNTNNSVFKSTGKFTEKYDVRNINKSASGGEYPNQDGFGWTNGVYLSLMG